MHQFIGVPSLLLLSLDSLISFGPFQLAHGTTPCFSPDWPHRAIG